MVTRATVKGGEEQIFFDYHSEVLTANLAFAIMKNHEDNRTPRENIEYHSQRIHQFCLAGQFSVA